MDRRDFLKVGGAAAVAGGGVAPLAAAQERKAPAIRPDAQRLVLAAADDTPGLGAARLAQRLETATGGRFRIAIETRATGSDAADPDLRFAPACDDTRLHPAFGVFAGLPHGLDAAQHETWLAVGGGQMLWDELAAGFGWKPLPAGHTGASAGLWASRRLETPADLAGATLHVSGPARDMLAALGATPVDLAPHEIRAALADGRIAAAEWLGPLAAVAPDLQPLAERLYLPGLTPAGLTIALSVRTPLWQRLSAADQAIFEACAAEEYRLSLADARAHALIARQVATPSKWPVRHAFAPALAQALERTAAEAVERIAATDAEARRIADSYAAFRALFGEPALA
jgi:TRAP-type mannitol/chloroaromatic compound transport system substrate-binding protein